MSEQSAKIQDDRTKRLSRKPYSWWWIVTAGATILFLGIGSLYMFNFLSRALALVIIAVSIATAIDPIVEFMCQKMYRVQAIVLVYLGLLLAVVAIGYFILPTLYNQLQQFVVAAPRYIDTAQNWIDQNTYLNPSAVTDWLAGQVGNLGSSLITVPVTIVTFLAEFLFTIFISIYWLIAMPRMRRFVLSLFPLSARDQADGVIAGMGQAMGGYLRGSVLDGIVLGIVKFIGLFLIGVPYAAVLAVLTAVLELLPTIGVTIAGTIAVLVALTVSPTMAIIVLVFEIVLQQLEGNILVPIIMKSQAELPALLSIFAVIAGAFIGGLLGAIVAIPLAAALMVFTQDVLAPGIRAGVGAPPVPNEGKTAEARETEKVEAEDQAEQTHADENGDNHPAGARSWKVQEKEGDQPNHD